MRRLVNLLGEYIKQNNINITEMAQNIGISRPALSKLAHQKIVPPKTSISTLVAIALYLNVNFSELFPLALTDFDIKFYFLSPFKNSSTKNWQTATGFISATFKLENIIRSLPISLELDIDNNYNVFLQFWPTQKNIDDSIHQFLRYLDNPTNLNPNIIKENIYIAKYLVKEILNFLKIQLTQIFSEYQTKFVIINFYSNIDKANVLVTDNFEIKQT